MKKIKNFFEAVFYLSTAILISPFLLVYGFMRKAWLIHQFRMQWRNKGKHILFIYSDSPNWKGYIDSNIVPLIESKTVFLNWSKRSEWETDKPLEAKILETWGTAYEFNPMAIVFKSQWKIETVRFFKAFKDFKHGNNSLLKEKEQELLSYLQVSSIK